MISPDLADAYIKMVQADTAYSNALTAVYGGRAGDIRYRTKEQSPAIADLGRAYVAAADAWRAASRPKPVKTTRQMEKV